MLNAPTGMCKSGAPSSGSHVTKLTTTCTEHEQGIFPAINPRSALRLWVSFCFCFVFFWLKLLQKIHIQRKNTCHCDMVWLISVAGDAEACTYERVLVES